MGTAMDINWHKECLKNIKLSIQRKQENFERLQKEIQRDYRDYDFYEKQIIEAEKEHKDKFDSDRYLKKVKRLY
jgi:hypothetical protein